MDKVADLFARLMTGTLGYGKFIAAGGDGGSIISMSLSQRHPEVLLGYHVTDVGYPGQTTNFAALSGPEQAYAGAIQQWFFTHGAFNPVHATKPQSLGFAMNDSPVGLAAWIVEKFRAWSDCDGDVERRFSKDVLLTNVMLYWITGAIGSSFWPYYARAHGGWPISERRPVRVPTAYASFPREILHPPRTWAERLYDIRRWTAMPAGGHFAALEEPEALAADVRAFFRSLR
jgi:pimeloyl-ACP methyl ester carboxylesterase